MLTVVARPLFKRSLCHCDVSVTMAVFLCRCINVIMSTVLGQAATCLAVAARKMSFHVGDLGAKGVSDCSGWLGGGGGGGSFRLLRLVGGGGGGG